MKYLVTARTEYGIEEAVIVEATTKEDALREAQLVLHLDAGVRYTWQVINMEAGYEHPTQGPETI